MNQGGMAQYVVLTPPVNLSAGALQSDWLSMKNANHIEIIVNKGAGAVGEPATLTLLQATSAAGAGAKALNIGGYSLKNGASMAAIGAPTRATAGANTYLWPAGDTESLLVLEIDAAQLDVNNGFSWIGFSIADPGATAQYLSAIARFSESRYNADGLSYIA